MENSDQRTENQHLCVKTITYGEKLVIGGQSLVCDLLAVQVYYFWCMSTDKLLALNAQRCGPTEHRAAAAADPRKQGHRRSARATNSAGTGPGPGPGPPPRTADSTSRSSGGSAEAEAEGAVSGFSEDSSGSLSQISTANSTSSSESRSSGVFRSAAKGSKEASKGRARKKTKGKNYFKFHEIVGMCWVR